MGVVQAAQEKRLFRTGGERGCVITRGGGFALEEAVLECGGGGGGGVAHGVLSLLRASAYSSDWPIVTDISEEPHLAQRAVRE